MSVMFITHGNHYVTAITPGVGDEMKTDIAVTSTCCSSSILLVEHPRGRGNGLDRRLNVLQSQHLIVEW